MNERCYSDHITFRVCDDGMSSDRMMKGDTVLVNTICQINHHDIALVVCESRRLLRRVEQREGKYVLLPSNPKMDPEIFDSVEIIGRVVLTLIDY